VGASGKEMNTFDKPLPTFEDRNGSDEEPEETISSEEQVSYEFDKDETIGDNNFGTGPK
jgi:hypothetical protein